MPLSSSRAVRGALALLGTSFLLAGCSRGLPVAPPEPQPSGSAYFACANLKAQLPERVLGNGTTATTPWSSLTTAWGDPAIVLRCGVPAPAALTPTSQLITIDGVDWFPEQLSDGYRFTSDGRAADVEVRVPGRYAPEVNPLVDLAAAMKKADPVEGS